MSNPELLIEPVSSPGILAAKLLLPFGSADDPAETRGAHDLLASLLSRGCGRHNHVDLADLVEGCGAGLRCDAQEDALVLSLRCTVEDAQQLLPLLPRWFVPPGLSLARWPLNVRSRFRPCNGSGRTPSIAPRPDGGS